MQQDGTRKLSVGTSHDIAPASSEKRDVVLDSAGQPRVPQHGRWFPVLVIVLSVLLVLIALRYVIPFYVEEVIYAATRGRQRAEVEVAADGLEKLNLTDLSAAFQLVAKRVGPSVVYIDTIKTREATTPRDEFGLLFGGNRLPVQQGSGVIMDTDGYILTNNHVIRLATKISVGLSEGRSVSAKVMGTDPLTDLALIKINAPGLIAATWGDSDQLDEGALVWAVGSPFGLDQSITAGILSAKNRPGLVSPHQQFLQTDAAVNPGNSGGPLVDALGRVVGINTAIVGEQFQGISFAIPSSIARNVYDDLKREGSVARGWLGVELAQAGSERARFEGFVDVGHGVLAIGVFDDSPALKAGLATGDVIVRWDGHEVKTTETLSLLVAKTEIGSTVDIIIKRDGRELTLNVRVGRRPKQMN